MSNYLMGRSQSSDVGRWFYKCPVCLSVAAIDGAPTSPVCSLCDVKMENMGKVKGPKLVNKELLTPCDARCTGAEGPACNCQCGGKNHGTGALVEVEHDAGGVPRVRPPDAAAAKRRAEFLQAKEEAVTRIEQVLGKDTLEKLKHHEWLPDGKYYQGREMLDAYQAARSLKTHKGRLKALAGVGAPRLTR